jgi:hypothetical protein
MTETQAQRQTIFTEGFRRVVCYSRELTFDSLVSGDESWFSYECLPNSSWNYGGVLFRLDCQRKLSAKVLGFHNLADVRLSQSSEIPCQIIVQRRILFCNYFS